MEYYAAIRRNELALYLLTWRDVCDVSVREISKRQCRVHTGEGSRKGKQKTFPTFAADVPLRTEELRERWQRNSWWTVGHGQWATGTA